MITLANTAPDAGEPGGAERSAMLARYRRDGHCTVRQLLPRGDVEQILKDTDRLFALQLHRLEQPALAYESEATVRANMAALLAVDVDAYLAAARHAAKLVSLQRLVTSPPIVELLTSIGLALPTMPTTPVLHIMCATLKIPGGYFGIAPHQDWPSVQGGLDTITVWIPLMDVDATRFPVEVIPGSHLRGLWDGAITDHALEITKGFVDSDFVPLPAARGDVVIFSGFTVHRTSLQGCRGLRIASSTRYENSIEPTFIERNYPCAYRRSVERELMRANFPSPEQVASLYR